MVQLRSQFVRMLCITPLLFARSASAQENETASHAKQATTENQSAEICSNLSVTNNERSQKRQLAAIFNKRIADKEKLWAKESKSISSTSDPGQDKSHRY